MAKYVKIQASKPFRVFGGMQTVDTTSQNPTDPNRLNVEALWTECFVILKQGVWYYPSVIKTWGSVKTLIANNYLTIGEEVDNIENADQLAYAKECYDRLKNAYDTLESSGFENPMKEKETKKPTAKKTSTKNLIDETNENSEE